MRTTYSELFHDSVHCCGACIFHTHQADRPTFTASFRCTVYNKTDKIKNRPIEQISLFLRFALSRNFAIGTVLYVF